MKDINERKQKRGCPTCGNKTKSWRVSGEMQACGACGYVHKPLNKSDSLIFMRYNLEDAQD